MSGKLEGAVIALVWFPKAEKCVAGTSCNVQ